MSGLLLLLTRRAVTQRRLLATVLAVVVAGTTVLGACTLLLTVLLQQGRSALLERAPDAQRTVAVVLSDVDEDAAPLSERAGALLATALGPLSTGTATWAQSGMQDLPEDTDGRRRLGYLAALDDLPGHATLASGRWPADTGAGGPLEAVLPVEAADRLGVRPGDQVLLRAPDADDALPSSVVVVGTVAPDPADVDTWGRDALQGTGWTPAFALGGAAQDRHPAFGPFLVSPQALLGAGVDLDEVRLGAVLDLGALPGEEVAALRARLADARAAVSTVVRVPDTGDLGGPYVRLDTPVPQLLDRVDQQSAVTSAAVLTVALVSTALAVSTLGLAGRLLAGRRAGERLLLSARGAGGRQLALLASTESLLLAGAGALLALPLTVGALRLLGRVPLLADAGLTGPTGPTAGLVVTVAGTAVLVAVTLAAPGLRPAATGRPRRRRRRGALIRSGADLVLTALAVGAWLELRSQQQTPHPGIDPVLVSAPVLVLLGGAVLALRVVPPAVRLAEHAAGRSRRLVLALVAWDVSRRPQATGAAFLLVLATAAATFAVAFTATWTTSQEAQATARVGADLTVPATGRDPLTQGSTVTSASGGQVHPTAVVPVTLGSVVRLDAGSADAAVPQLLAVDTASAGSLLRGRLPGDTTWAGLTRDLVPAPTAGVPLGSDPVTLTLTGSSSAGAVAARPALLVADASGSRTTLTGEPVALDGSPHAVALTDATGAVAGGAEGLTVVGSTLDLSLLSEDGISAQGSQRAAVEVAARIEGAVQTSTGAWPTSSPGSDGSTQGDLLQGVGTTVAPVAGGALVTGTADVSLTGLLYDTGHLVVTAAPVGTDGTAPAAAAPVPVLVSGAVARAAQLGPGAVVPLQVRGTTVRARVTGVVPYLPSLPGTPGVLVDYTALADALARTGDTGPLTSAWWVDGVPDPGAAVAGLAAAGLPGAQTGAQLAVSLRDGPLGVPLRVALVLLICGAVVLALAGAALHSAAAQGGRVVEVARLHALGVRRRTLAAVLVLQHGVVTALSVVVGAALGALASVLVAGRLTRSETGTAPAPTALVQWPWPAETAVVALLVVGCAVVAVPVTVALVRRAGAVHLRLDDAS
ncbi:ABC transporter permease [Modestobacter sp. L9-4]|uniref:ABC transporter permease n=1 Tax=Modestobacter sp. L9-4 TaxID=2851567 RepID=UPI001C75A74B|nr:ABC transporter permease [Modestobacter sp. L9-4]QXG77451.1 ABC transporter permease [Modestobacter sp. L9-4]